MLYERFLSILEGLSFNPVLNENDMYLNHETISITILGEKDGFSQVVKYHFSKETKECIGCEII